MGRAKDIVVKPIRYRDAARIIRSIHYSGKIKPGSQVHLGVFLDGKCGGALQFGPPMDKRRMAGLVDGTKWHEFMELNRMALADWLPRNGESRALAMSIRLLKSRYPCLKWIVTFADATQCGDGTIYRAAGFVLTAIKRNSGMLLMPNGNIVSTKTLGNPNHTGRDGRPGCALAKENGAVPLAGFQLRYIYFIDRSCRKLLTVPEIPYSEIAKRGAGMYKGELRQPVEVSDSNPKRRCNSDPDAPLSETATDKKEE